ncbi:MAG TPA: tat pathway signal sequence [Streptosporangiaceae bacterium]|nr:tat pathway signal sequence [Streptosporangiaceae bacterium]
MQKRIGEVESYLAGSPGEIGIVLRNRQDGAVWQNSDAGTELPAASTVKLAMVVDLLLRNQSGQIDLSDDDWDQIDQMLHASSDTAADQLWSEYFDGSFLSRIAGYGMPGAEFTQDPPYWGYMYCTADDLDGLIGYVLDKLPASMRTFIVGKLRSVAPDQQFGVWGAGSRADPGNKDGWEDDSGVWMVDSVGFAGPGARYTLSMMYDLEGNGSFSDGANTLTQVAALLFRGHPTAAPTIQATP